MRVDSLVSYLTIFPELGAAFEGGKDALVAYFKEACYPITKNLKKDKLQPGKIAFLIKKDGSIKNIGVTESCGLEQLDLELVKAVKNIPLKWTPAKNGKRDNVDQELIFFWKEGR
jgi:hypothetical protein